MLKLKFLRLFNFSRSQKAKIKKILPGAAMITALLVAVAITFFHTTDGFTKLVDIEPASMVVEKNHMSFTSYTLKNEIPISSSSYNGGVYYLADDAERINPGDPLANVYEKKIDNKVIELSREIERCIGILEESIGDGVFTLGESKEVKQNILSVYLDIMRSSLNGDGAFITAQADRFLTLLNQVEMFSNDGAQLKVSLSSYLKEEERLRENYSGAYETVNAAEGGYFFKSTDGYENIYSSANIAELTYESFFEMTDKEAESGSFIGKMMLDYRWYLVVPTVKGISDTFFIGRDYEITFPDSGNETYEMVLDNILYDSTGSKSLMIFMCGMVDSDFNLLRVQQINITHRNVTGYRIPETAVCEVGGNTGVYILSDGMASFRKISILYEGDGYYIVSADTGGLSDYYQYLKLNDNIITDCRNMHEGKVIG